MRLIHRRLALVGRLPRIFLEAVSDLHGGQITKLGPERRVCWLTWDLQGILTCIRLHFFLQWRKHILLALIFLILEVLFHVGNWLWFDLFYNLDGLFRYLIRYLSAEYSLATCLKLVELLSLKLLLSLEESCPLCFLFVAQKLHLLKPVFFRSSHLQSSGVSKTILVYFTVDFLNSRRMIESCLRIVELVLIIFLLYVSETLGCLFLRLRFGWQDTSLITAWSSSFHSVELSLWHLFNSWCCCYFIWGSFGWGCRSSPIRRLNYIWLN